MGHFERAIRADQVRGEGGVKTTRRSKAASVLVRGALLVVLGFAVGCGPVSTATPTSFPAGTASPSLTFSPEQLQMLDFIRS